LSFAARVKTQEKKIAFNLCFSDRDFCYPLHQFDEIKVPTVQDLNKKDYRSSKAIDLIWEMLQSQYDKENGN